MRIITRSALVAAMALSFFIACQAPNSTSKSETTKEVETPVNKNSTRKTILFFGNSITAAYGLEPAEAFSSLIQNKIDSIGLEYECINAGNSGETTKGGLSRLDWVMKEPIDIMVLELGANDGLRGYSPEETKANLEQLIQKFMMKNPNSKVLLAGMKVPPSMGDQYFLEFEQIFTELGTIEGVVLIPFLLENVAGIKELNLPDGIHPTAEGHRIISETVWAKLYPILEK
ncbi:MAG: arylesterase [Crocinitomicaceae bacterium]|nr:arylesterase [Crocinitomicaceae bacterium]|tara:strand:+ start:5354 stop:6043 length:690 start_codon:yes stop_codon:yes gene_type:complete